MRIILQELKDALIVPYSGVQISQKGPYLFVIKPDSTAEFRLIQSGQRQGDDQVVLSGVTEGETVVATGQMAVGPGSKLKVVTPGAPAGAAAAGKPPEKTAKPDEAKPEAK